MVFEMRDTQGDSFEASRLNYNVNIPELNNGSSDPADIKIVVIPLKRNSALSYIV